MPFSGIRGATARLLDENEIPLIGLGTYALWSQTEVDVAVESALKDGYRLFDTANYYGNEKELGNAFKKLLPKCSLRREDIFIVTKANIRSSNVEENAKEMVKNSLHSLQTDYIDLMLIHYPKDWGTSDKNVKNPEHRLRMYRMLEGYKEAGSIRSIGVSNFEVRHIEELWDKVKHKPVANQCEFHPHLTRPELREYCRGRNIFFQAHTPLAANSKSICSDSTIVKIAQQHNTTVPKVLLAFAYQQGVGVIPKSKSPERIAANIGFLNVKLSEEQIGELNRLNRERRYSDCDGWNVF